MAIRHYVLLSTDGFINLPLTPTLCASLNTTERTYIFGFAGGLYQVFENGVQTYNNPIFNWYDPANWPALRAMTSTATIPSPMIWGETGDNIYITLINLGMPIGGVTDLHTVHLHGAHVATQIDGFPETSFSVPVWTNFSVPPPTATYYFKPEDPGTYMYHCHVTASEHIQMGMYGALVIYPTRQSLAAEGIVQNPVTGDWFLNGFPQPQIPPAATNRNFAYNDIKTYFDKEYVLLLSDIDYEWHKEVLGGHAFYAPDYKPDFWLVNGRAFPDTLLPHPLTPSPGSDPNLAQINYESYVHVKTNQKFLLRMINLAYQVAPWHIHGWHFTVVGKDASPSPFLKISETLNFMGHEGLEMGFTVTIGSGETYDLLLSADDKRPIYQNYIVNGQDNILSLCLQMNIIQAFDPAAIADIPTEPVICPTPDTVNYINICNGTQGVDQYFPQFYPMHNHDDYKVTNNGRYPGGQLTYIQTDAP